MNLAAYLRVSTDRQADEGGGLETQRATIEAWAKEHGHKIRAWYSDEGISGTNGIETRAALVDVLAAVKAGAAGIVVVRLDRLARSLILQEQLLADVRARGGRVFSTAPGEDAYLDEDPADPSRRLIRQVLGAVAEYEKNMTRARMRAGTERKKAAGGYHAGAPPYGWRPNGRGELEQVPAEQTQIGIMLALRAKGDSLRRIAQVLDQSGAPPRKGASWNADSIRKIIGRAQRQ